MKQLKAFKLALVVVSSFMAFSASAAPPPVVTDDPDDEPQHVPSIADDLVRADPSAPLAAHDAAVADIVSDAPFAKVIKNLAEAGRGERLSANSTTDVWALGNYAYTGTFNSPCGGDPDAGIWIWDVRNKTNPEFVGVIQSPTGSRTNDVRVATMGRGDILVHSNEPCAGGPGGYEVYNVEDPLHPVHLASVRIDDPNPLAPLIIAGPVTDVGVHNLWLFSQAGKDYVAVTTETVFGNFHIYDITDPANPMLVSFWGAEELFDPGVVASGDVSRNLDAAIWLFSGFGASQNRFLHDVTITPDGLTAYLANWDAGLVRLDITDVSNPQLVSVAIDPTSEDGEVNSHSVWPNANGSIVVEGEEDFSPFESQFTIDGSGPNAGTYASSEGEITSPIAEEPGAEMSGQTTYVGLACDGASVPAGSGIALIQRGVCAFTVKGGNVIAAGYSGMVVFNDEARGDALVTMGGTAISIPGVFVGHSTGLAIMGVANAADLVIGAGGATITAAVIPNGWSGMRIWSYADPANPILMSTFNTVCSANPTDPSCDPRGTYSSHNVIVEDNKAYISWYSDGVVVLDVSDPVNPVEVARYHRTGSEFETQNAGIQDVWGIYKIPNQPWIYASDRNGGLYILKEYGSGSAKNAKD
ncbi:LVIVD repeat-containing protein [Marinobacter daqiaonensis]|uniref:LVIVD repeat-containing protein n=1 Tax=Marinobacter daqiaonensis TaxID=650891 RepID=A0A1I6GQZ1_9GAMM|nr:PA domain-containing protein [Marinobacter daqiaonensis]SFR44663.1 LVIVD repeat-containing protein [Marinobacter daqiaonensis]